jgi:hypothetical protein
MTVETLAKSLGFEVVCIPDGNREVSGVYIGDLLSWVMGRATQDNVWITIMSNLNIVAVATLSDVSCILLAEDVILDEEIKLVAEEKHVNILRTSLSAYECAVRLSKEL